MKNILVVDNGTSSLPQIVDVLKPLAHITICEYWDNLTPLIEQMRDSIDAVLLSGGGRGSSKRVASVPFGIQHGYYNAESELIRSFHGPILGICLGAQLINMIYGGQQIPLKGYRKGKIKLVPTPFGEKLFTGSPNLESSINHSWQITELGTDLLEAAHVDNEIYAFQHRTRKITGVLFHPHEDPNKSCGAMVIKNALSL